MTKFDEALSMLLFAAACGVATACGGSASETPPPMEPTNNPRAPYAERARPSSSSAQSPKRVDATDGAPDGDASDPAGAGEAAPEAVPGAADPALEPVSPE